MQQSLGYAEMMSDSRLTQIYRAYVEGGAGRGRPRRTNFDQIGMFLKKTMLKVPREETRPMRKEEANEVCRV